VTVSAFLPETAAGRAELSIPPLLTKRCFLTIRLARFRSENAYPKNFGAGGVMRRAVITIAMLSCLALSCLALGGCFMRPTMVADGTLERDGKPLEDAQVQVISLARSNGTTTDAKGHFLVLEDYHPWNDPRETDLRSYILEVRFADELYATSLKELGFRDLLGLRCELSSEAEWYAQEVDDPRLVGARKMSCRGEKT